MSKLRLSVGIPAYGGMISANHARMWTEFGNTIGGSSERFALVDFGFWDVNPVDKARNLMLDRAVKLGADWLLMIDADTWIEPGKLDRESGTDAGFLLLRMISDAERAGATVVVAPVMPRTSRPGEDTFPMIWVERPSGEMGCPKEEIYQRALIEIDEAATAVFAISIPRLVASYPKEGAIEFEFKPDVSEDRYFCRRVRQNGGKIFADTRVRTGHMSRSAPIYSTEP